MIDASFVFDLHVPPMEVAIIMAPLAVIPLKISCELLPAEQA